MTTVTTIPTGTYAVDPIHSNVGFEVKHMGIATVRGAFKTFAGNIEATDDSLTLSGTVDVASVDTGNGDRDGHLQSPDFFDAAQHPQISFASSTADFAGEDITLTGEITIKGVTQPITFTGKVKAAGDEDPWGNQRAGFEVETTVDRTAFDMAFNQTLPNGTLLVANDVKLVVSVSAVKTA
jgi:polyisoprenoid-binding protein YceI